MTKDGETPGFELHRHEHPVRAARVGKLRERRLGVIAELATRALIGRLGDPASVGAARVKRDLGDQG